MRYRFTQLLFCLSVLTVFIATSVLAAPPNILFISVDDLNDWTGCLGGHPQAKTPNIDRLAKSGLLFTNAYCPAASCNPSRSAIFTGIEPNRSGVYHNRQKMRERMPDEEIIPKYLSRHGYETLGSGKLLHYFIDAPSWDDYYPEKTKECPFPRTFYPKERPVGLPYHPWMYVEFDWAALDMDDQKAGGDKLVADWVVKQLQRKHEKPFFLGCGIFRPHVPWFVPKKYFEPFPLKSIELPPGYKEDDLDDLPPGAKSIVHCRYHKHIVEKEDKWREAMQGYLASIAYADAMVGRVLDALEEGPNAKNTIVILWSDHGWHLGEKKRWRKFSGWRIGTRVPLIFNVPKGTPGLPGGTQPGSVCSRAVSLNGLFKTITTLAGVPEKKGVGGDDLTPLLANPKLEWNHPAVTFFGKDQRYAVSHGDWRYIHYQDGSEELYNIKKDPHEWENLAAKPEFAKELTRMRKLVDSTTFKKSE